MMDDTISRSAAIDAVLNDERIERNYGDVSPEGVIKVIESLPAVDAAPVEHSFWIRCDYAEYDHHGECVHYPNEGVKCFKCCYVFRANYLWSREYCPHCGAKMDWQDSECS